MAEENEAEKKEKEYVHVVYSKIAAHFSDTRYNPWPKVADFISKLPAGSLVADVGCGNGKYLGVNPDLFMMGSDICPELVAIAKGHGHDVIVGDCLSLPYRNGVFDAVICIAVIHHLSTEERRIQAIEEMARILRPDGLILVYVWAMEQTRKKFTEQDVMVPWHLQPRYSGGTPTCVLQPHKKKKERKKKKQLVCDQVDDMNDSSNATIIYIPHEAVSSLDHTHSVNEACDISDPLIDCTPSLIEITKPVHLVSELITQCPDHTSSVMSECTEQTLLIEPMVDHSSSTEAIADHTPLLTEPNQTSLTETIVKPVVTGCTDHTHVDELHQLGYVTYQRYYHVFCEGELSSLCGHVHCLKLLSSWYDHDNWCVLMKKIE